METKDYLEALPVYVRRATDMTAHEAMSVWNNSGYATPVDADRTVVYVFND